MNIITMSEALTFVLQKSCGGHVCVFEPFRKYVVSDHQYQRMEADENIRRHVFKRTSLESRLTNFHYKMRDKAKRQRLLLYNGAGGYGDQIMTWPVARWLAEVEGWEVHALVDPGNEYLWWLFPWLRAHTIIPITYEAFQLYENHLIFEQLSNFDEHQDQLHPVDVMLEKIGFDSASIAPEFKSVAPNITKTELARVKGITKERKYAVYQAAASNPNRSLTPDTGAFLVKQMANEYPHLHWFCLHDDYNNKSYPEAIRSLGLENVETLKLDYIRDIFPLVRMSEFAVTPDTLCVHAAGCQKVPCVSLWGVTNPMGRIKYYSNQYAIHPRKACRYSPCQFTGEGYPSFCPPPPEGGSRCDCESLSSITPEMVLEGIHKVYDPNKGNADKASGDGPDGRDSDDQPHVPVQA